MIWKLILDQQIKVDPLEFIYKVRIPFNIAIEITMLSGILWFYIKTSIKLDINR